MMRVSRSRKASAGTLATVSRTLRDRNNLAKLWLIYVAQKSGGAA